MNFLQAVTALIPFTRGERVAFREKYPMHGIRNNSGILEHIYRWGGSDLTWILSDNDWPCSEMDIHVNTEDIFGEDWVVDSCLMKYEFERVK